MSNTLLDSHLASPKVVDHWHMLSTVALILLQWALLLGVNKHSKSLALTKAHSHYRIQFQNFYQKCNFTAWLWVRHWAQSQINIIDLPSKVSFMPGSLCRDCERILKHQVQPLSMFGVWNLSQGNWTWHVITLPGPQWLRILILRVSYSIKDGSSWQISSPSLSNWAQYAHHHRWSSLAWICNHGQVFWQGSLGISLWHQPTTTMAMVNNYFVILLMVHTYNIHPEGRPQKRVI